MHTNLLKAVVLIIVFGKINYVFDYPHDTSNKNFIIKYFRCKDGKRTETRIGMEGICITHSYPFLHSTVHCVHAGMGNTDTLHPNSCFCSFSIPTSEIF